MQPSAPRIANAGVHMSEPQAKVNPIEMAATDSTPRGLEFEEDEMALLHSYRIRSLPTLLHPKTLIVDSPFG